jgi:GxxExxY protein
LRIDREEIEGLKDKRACPLFTGDFIECGYRIDLLVEDEIVVEVKAVERFDPIHEAQLLSYLKLSKHPVGLLINFNVKILKNGVLDWSIGFRLNFLCVLCVLCGEFLMHFKHRFSKILSFV